MKRKGQGAVEQGAVGQGAIQPLGARRRVRASLRRLPLTLILAGASGCTLVGYPGGPVPAPPGVRGAPPGSPGSTGSTDDGGAEGGGNAAEGPANPGTAAPDLPAGDTPNAIPREEEASRYGNPESYEVDGTTYHVLETTAGYDEVGIASWYGEEFHGRRTSSGEPYDMHAMTAAHRTLPIPCYVEVRNLENGRTVIVRVNDRGPFHSERILDLSYAAARRLGIVRAGTARVRVRTVGPEVRRPPSAP